MPTELDDSVALLSRALDQTGDVLAAIHRDKLSDSTPCGDWNVSTLIAHVVNGPRNFIAMTKGEEPDWSAAPELPADWAGAFRSAADDLLHVWHQGGGSGSAATVDWQTAEFAIHTWDLARATGQSTDLDPKVGDRALELMKASLKPEHRGSAADGFVFGEEVSVPADAPVYDRLAAFAGRDPRLSG